MNIHCKYDKLIDPKTLSDHPKNHNKHGSDQIERLSELYKYHGIRHPIIVSNLSGCIVAGHGRKLAAIRGGIKAFPVVYQDFSSNEAEYAFIQSDNAIAEWSELDLSAINMDIADLGPDFDLNMLAIKDFTLDFSDKELPELNGEDNKFMQRTFVLSMRQNSLLDKAMKKVEDNCEIKSEDNQNKNGNILEKILEFYVQS